MKIFVTLIFILCVDCELSYAQNANRNWSDGTAFTLPENRFEVGIFQPLRYGLSETIEVSAHPLMFFVMPNVTVKLQQINTEEFVISTKHTLLYPTWILKLIAREGTGGIISPEFDIPDMFEFYNEVLLSTTLLSDHLLTGKAGLTLSTKFGKLDKRTTIDLPLVYHRLLVFYSGYGLRLGADIEGKLAGSFSYLFDVDYFYTPGQKFNESLESKALIFWRWSERSELCLGVKLVYGEYPFGTQWHLLLPLIDYRYAWN